MSRSPLQARRQKQEGFSINQLENVVQAHKRPSLSPMASSLMPSESSEGALSRQQSSSLRPNLSHSPSMTTYAAVYQPSHTASPLKTSKSQKEALDGMLPLQAKELKPTETVSPLPVFDVELHLQKKESTSSRVEDDTLTARTVKIELDLTQRSDRANQMISGEIENELAAVQDVTVQQDKASDVAKVPSQSLDQEAETQQKDNAQQTAVGKTVESSTKGLTRVIDQNTPWLPLQPLIPIASSSPVMNSSYSAQTNPGGGTPDVISQATRVYEKTLFSGTSIVTSKLPKTPYSIPMQRTPNFPMIPDRALDANALTTKTPLTPGMVEDASTLTKEGGLRTYTQEKALANRPSVISLKSPLSFPKAAKMIQPIRKAFTNRVSSFVPPVGGYSETHQRAAIIIQSWWRGLTVRMWLSLALVNLRFSSGPTISDVSKLGATGTRKIPRREGDFRKEKESMIKPWPKELVRALCSFLDSIQKPQEELKPSDLRIFGGSNDTIERVYNKQSADTLPPFAFAVEKRALRQLKISKEAREKCAARLAATSTTSYSLDA